MAAISLDDCTVTHIAALAGLNMERIVTPATADDADTIDVSSLFPNNVVLAIAQASTDGALSCTGLNSTTITLPGSTDNEARTIFVVGY